MRAFKPSVDHVSLNQDVLVAWNFNWDICWFSWELTIGNKQTERNIEREEGGGGGGGGGGHVALFI